MWPSVDGATRGRTLEETFLRSIKILLWESIARSYDLSLPLLMPGARNSRS